MLPASSLLCGFEEGKYLLFSTNIPSLVYYSHFSAIIISAFLAIILFLKSNRSLPVKILLSLIIPFIGWVFLDSVFWASNRSDVIMFVWSLQILLEPLTYLAGIYLVYVLIKKRDLNFKYKIILFACYAPLIILTPTKYFLPAFNIVECLSVETIWSYYTYLLEAASIIWIALFAIRESKNTSVSKQRKEIATIGLGVVLFLLFFASGNIIGSLTGNWHVAQTGLIGAPILIAFLAYSIVNFKTFNTKILGTQVLVVTLWIALAAVLFLRTIENVRIIISLTLILFLITGIFLVRSVKREVEQREKIQRLADDLQSANDKLKELDQLKSEFLSLATHQIRAPLTAIKGYSSMLLEGDFGVLPPKAANSVEIVMKSCQNLINIVNDFLNISRIEQGRMVYEKSIFDIGALVNEVANEIKPNVQSAGLELQVNIKSAKQEVNADRNKIKQAISNLVDNSIKYTVKGGILIAVFTEGNKVKVAIKDTGVGIDPQEMGKLFAKFSRTKDANKTNVVGTGLGLYIAKKMVEAHQGDIKVTSDGLGKGTTFTIELPKYS